MSLISRSLLSGALLGFWKWPASIAAVNDLAGAAFGAGSVVGVRPSANAPHDAAQFAGAQFSGSMLAEGRPVQLIGLVLHLAQQARTRRALVVQPVGDLTQRLERRAVAALGVCRLRRSGGRRPAQS